MVILLTATACAVTAVVSRRHRELDRRVTAMDERNRVEREHILTVTHDLRTALTAMTGLVSTVASAADRLPPERLRELALTARDQGGRLQRLIEELEATAAVSAGSLLRPRSCELGQLVEELAAGLGPLVERHTLVVKAASGARPSCLDPDVVARVLGNLVENAVKYTPPASTITVAAERERDGVLLVVTDDGPGMPAAERRRAFEKFRRSADPGRRGGKGLGLHTVRSLAEAHGGWAALAEAAGGGLEAVVWLADLEAGDERSRHADRTRAARSSG